jgi:hypothetical protein
MSFCGNCGTQIPEGSDFCPNCGQKIDVVANAQQTTTQNQAEQQANQQGTDATDANQAQQQGTYQANQGTYQANQQGTYQANQQGAYQANQGNQGNFQGQQYGYANQVKQPNAFMERLKTDKKMQGICVGVVALIVLLIGLVVWRVNAAKTVDISDYVTVTFEGADSAGTAVVDIDEDKLYNALTDAGGDKIISYYGQYEVMNSIDVTVTPNEDLSNGDKVTVQYTYSKAIAKKYGIKLKGKDEKIKVSGLKDVEAIDPFEYVTIKYEGMEPYIYPEVEVDSSKIKFLDEIYFSTDVYSGLSDGDEFTVTAEIDEDYALSQGYYLKETEKTYTVNADNKYLASVDDLTETQLAELQKAATDEITAEMATEDYTISEPAYIGAYLLNAKEKSYSSGNKLYLVYQVQATDTEDGEFADTTVYMPVEIEDVVVSSDGTIDYYSADLYWNYEYPNDGWTSVYGYLDGAEMYNELVTANVSDYTATVYGDALKAFGE